MLSGLLNSQTVAIKFAAWQFASKRAAYYEDMAGLLERSHLRLLDIFVQDGQRFGNAPRGILARHWADRYLEMGADLAEAWADTMPEVDVAIIRVQANAGSDAIPGTLRDLARLSRLTKNIQNQAISALMAGVVTFLLALMMIMYLVPFIINTMRESLGIPVQYWGSIGKTMAGIASFAENYRIAVFIALAVLFFMATRIANWTGRFRAWCDEHIIGITTLRDIAAIRVLLIMRTITSSRGGEGVTFDTALQRLLFSFKSPWMRWRLGQILENVLTTGATNTTVFNTGLFPQDVYWRLRDIEEGRGFSEAFQITSEYIEEIQIPRLQFQLATFRWLLILPSILVGLAIMLGMQATSFEMRSVLATYNSSSANR